MKLVRFWLPGMGERTGCVVGDEVFDLTGATNGRIGCVFDLLTGRKPAGEVMDLLDKPGIPKYDYSALDVRPSTDVPHLLRPIDPPEIWAAGVTYERSLKARKEESSHTDFYDRVYSAERPEIFFKDTGVRTAGPNQPIGVRGDSAWMVPEPELALVIGNDCEIVGYTIGNDVSSRDIEGENPLYLPQAKIFSGCCALGPSIVSRDQIGDPYSLTITCKITRENQVVFEGCTSTGKIVRKFEDLVHWLSQSNVVLPGTVLLTGTCVVPPDDFSLTPGDQVQVRGYTRKDQISMCMVATLSIVTKPYLRAPFGFVQTSMGLPVGVFLGGLYMFWPVLVGCVIQKPGVVFWTCVLQGIVALLTGFTGLLGPASFLSYIAPGVAIELLYLALQKVDASSARSVARWVTPLAAGAVGNGAGAMMNAFLFFAITGKVAALALGISMLTGAVGGWLAALVAPRLVTRGSLGSKAREMDHRPVRSPL